MKSCAEADYYYRICGQSKRDADGDGIPCEKVCGGTLTIMRQRIEANPFVPEGALPIQPLLQAQEFRCGTKSKCSQMVSCAEAKFHLASCGNKRLDGDRDGIPCNALCR